MEKLITQGVTAVGEVALDAVKGFTYLAGAGVGLIVISFGAEKGLYIFQLGVDLLKAIVTTV